MMRRRMESGAQFSGYTRHWVMWVTLMSVIFVTIQFNILRFFKVVDTVYFIQDTEWQIDNFYVGKIKYSLNVKYFSTSKHMNFWSILIWITVGNIILYILYSNIILLNETRNQDLTFRPKEIRKLWFCLWSLTKQLSIWRAK